MDDMRWKTGGVAHIQNNAGTESENKWRSKNINIKREHPWMVSYMNGKETSTTWYFLSMHPHHQAQKPSFPMQNKATVTYSRFWTPDASSLQGVKKITLGRSIWRCHLRYSKYQHRVPVGSTGKSFEDVPRLLSSGGPWPRPLYDHQDHMVGHLWYWRGVRPGPAGDSVYKEVSICH